MRTVGNASAGADLVKVLARPLQRVRTYAWEDMQPLDVTGAIRLLSRFATTLLRESFTHWTRRATAKTIPSLSTRLKLASLSFYTDLIHRRAL
jgi:hypothetical protein